MAFQLEKLTALSLVLAEGATSACLMVTGEQEPSQKPEGKAEVSKDPVTPCVSESTGC